MDSCPSCGVAIGRLHARGCSIGLCKPHGLQRASCLHSGEHAATTFHGFYPGELEAMQRGWTEVTFGTEHADIHRVIRELRWNPETERFE